MFLSKYLFIFVDIYTDDVLVNKYKVIFSYSTWRGGRLRGLAVACWITDHYHPGLNLGLGISEGCFIFDFASFPLEVTQPI